MEELLSQLIVLMRRIVFPEYLGQDDRALDLMSVRSVLRKIAGDKIADAFMERIPYISRLLHTDVEAIADNDPAVTDRTEVVLCYPGIRVMLHYRTAHELLLLEVPVAPRLLTEMAHSATGIDIHPGAQIGEYFAIDHGTGVVIGATTVIGNHVMLYQGVTLGAKNIRYDHDGRPVDEPRHPILEDNVTVYANTTVLGRVVIGHDTVVGGNVWLTHSVPPRSRILQTRAIEQPLFADGAGI
ncbi:serine O-acetyltransferase [Bacteroidales bacterium WCE2004]|nr:serine acetyltransferase [Bacteroidales bacterium]SKC62923.1 serine O-acetyltransferase [Bacteroidales bacterium WCE2004]